MSQENEKHVHILEDGTVVEHSHGDHDHEAHGSLTVEYQKNILQAL